MQDDVGDDCSDGIEMGNRIRYTFANKRCTGVASLVRALFAMLAHIPDR
jgi:hypothetical protein